MCRTLFQSLFPVTMFPDTGNLDSLFIGIFNANGLHRQATECSAWVFNNNLDIVLVGEAHFSQGNVSRIANYELYNDDRALNGNNRSLDSTAIYIKRVFSATSSNIPNLNFVETTIIILISLLFQNFSLHLYMYLLLIIWQLEIQTCYSKIFSSSLILFQIILLWVTLILSIPLGIVEQQMDLAINSRRWVDQIVTTHSNENKKTVLLPTVLHIYSPLHKCFIQSRARLDSVSQDHYIFF